ncbi:MAG: exosortase/archaeosortase family protein [Planctomycetota bacterium]
MAAAPPATADSSPRPEASASGSGWDTRRATLGVLLGLLAVWAGWRAWSDIFYIAARDEEASQVWLVLPIFAWLVWSRKDALAKIRPSYSLLGPALIAIGWAVSLHGFFNLQQALWHGGVVLVAIGALATVAGPRLMRALLPTLVVLAFLVPVPGMIRQRIAIPMQTYTASASEFVFQLLAMPVTRSGNVLTYNGQEVLVAEACNGMRMIFALLLVTYAFVLVMNLRPSVRVLILLFSPVLAVACNVIRIAPTVYLYGQSPEHWGPLFHNLAGWAMLIVTFILLMGVVRLLQWAEVPIMQPAPARSPDKPNLAKPVASRSAATPA